MRGAHPAVLRAGLLASPPPSSPAWVRPAGSAIPSHPTWVNHAFIAGSQGWGAASTCLPPLQCLHETMAPHPLPPMGRGVGECEPQTWLGLGGSVVRGCPRSRCPRAPAGDVQPGPAEGLAARSRSCWGGRQHPARPGTLGAPRPAAPSCSDGPAGLQPGCWRSPFLSSAAWGWEQLPAELRQPVAQLPSLHTCSARLR